MKLGLDDFVGGMKLGLDDFAGGRYFLSEESGDVGCWEGVPWEWVAWIF